MPLTAGARLGAYTVVSQLGAGGMGEVYRARDTRLDRDVAIKVLPPHLSVDEAARTRFEREAKAIAALSHPNILAVYDVGVSEGIAFVVMELLEGETLRQRLSETAGSALPIRKVAQIGIEIAYGLAAAHEKQIVHRDIKPENIFLAADGRVKILDFGLARQASAPAAATESATQLQQTDPGTVMGTIGYMAPEQVKALAVDHRADIFSLGCVLYEMASGRRPFARDTAAETMTAILRDDPPDLVRDSGVMPAAFEPIVRHCIEKRPEERFQSARDLAFALQSLSSVSPGVAAPAPTSPRAAARSPTWSAALGLAAAVAALAAVATYLLARANSGAPPVSSVQIESFQQLTDTAGVDTSPTMSPDGKTVVFVSDRSGSMQLYSQRVGSRSAIALTSGAASAAPAFSPNGEKIAFRSERDGGGIFLMTATGESITRVSDEGHMPSWSPNGEELVCSRAAFISPADAGGNKPGLLVVDVASGRKRELQAGTLAALQPAWSPHGQRIAYFGLRQNSGQRDLFTIAADGAGTGPVDVTNDPALDWSPVWSPDGTYLYFSSNRGGTMNLWRVAIDEATGRLRGTPEPVTTPSIYSGRMSFSRDGSQMAYASLDWRSTLLRQNFDAAREETVGPPTPILKGSRPIRDHAISPDGTWVAFNETSAREDLFVARVDGTEYRRLTDDAARDRGPVWAPDGKAIFFYSDRSGVYDVWSIPPDGSAATALTKGVSANFPALSPDGKRFALSGVGATGLQIRDIAAGPDAPAVLEPPFGEGRLFWAFGWSGRNELIGTVVNAQAQVETLAVYDVATKRYRAVAGAEDTNYTFGIWLRDGRRILVRGSSGITLVDTVTGKRKLLTPVRGYMIGRSLDISSDNKWYSYTETGTEGDIWIANLRKQ